MPLETELAVPVVVEDAALAERFDRLKREIEAGTAEPIQAAWRQAGARYLTFIRRRFNDASRGDGTWPDLAYSTKLARRRGTLTRLRHDLSQRWSRLSESIRLQKAIADERKRLRLNSLRRQLGRARTAEDSARIRRLIRNLLAQTMSPKAAGKKAGAMLSLELGTFSILRDTGTLFNSLTQGAAGNVFEGIPNGIVVGTAVKYAKYHQEGGRNLPKREILVPPSEELWQVINGLVAAGINRLIGQHLSGT